jgi:hypothetical protein
MILQKGLQDTLMLKDSNLYGIAYCCPVVNRRNDCPFKGFDNLSFREKIEWIDGMSQAEKDAILGHHMSCTKSR